METADQTENCILIVDDDSKIRSLLRALLGDFYECAEADSAEEALTLIQTQKFKLILSDIQMSGISGLEMVPLIRRHSPGTVMMMISSQKNIEGAVEAMRAGAFDYITKPFDLGYVEAAVNRALEHYELLETKRRYENHLEELIDERTAERDHLTYHDALTGLPNRALFLDRLTQAVTLSKRHGQMLAVMSIAVDRFKKINDALGNAVGDRLLCGVAERLASLQEKGITVSSRGDEEFTLLVPEISRAEDAVSIFQKIREAVKPAFTIGEQELFVTVSVGTALHPPDGEDAQTLLQNSGIALYRAKLQGGDTHEFYRADMNEESLKRLGLESYLRRAVERDELIVHYQPQVNADTGQMVGMEALVRWEHPDLGLVSPADFIPLAEETGLIVGIGEWVLRTACAQNKAWQNENLSPLRVAVNFSPRQFQQPDLVGQIRRVLEETGLAPEFLEVELTESSVMKSPNAAIKVLQQLKDIGVNIAIDDFGTGYSSLNYLKRFPLDVLKIDRSFISETPRNADDTAIVAAIITLAHSLKLKVIAEGVETEEQLEFLRHLKCDEIQGYLFSKPLPAETFGEMLRQERSGQPQHFKPIAGKPKSNI